MSPKTAALRPFPFKALNVPKPLPWKSARRCKRHSQKHTLHIFVSILIRAWGLKDFKRPAKIFSGIPKTNPAATAAKAFWTL